MMDFCGTRRGMFTRWYFHQVALTRIGQHVRWLVARSYTDARLPAVLAAVEGLVRP